MAWSLTKLKTFETCGARYDYKYNQHLPDVSSQAAADGQRKHKEMEGFINGTLPTLTGPLEFYYGFLTALKDSPVPLYTEYRIALNKDWTRCTEREEPWYIGYLDLFRKGESTANFWDWKSGKIYPGHLEDMEVYAVATMAAHPEIETLTATYTYIDKGQNRERLFSREAEFDALRAKWTPRVERMETATQFIPNPQFFCRYCSYSKRNGGPCPF